MYGCSSVDLYSAHAIAHGNGCNIMYKRFATFYNYTKPWENKTADVKEAGITVFDKDLSVTDVLEIHFPDVNW